MQIDNLDQVRKAFGDMPVDKALRSVINKVAAKGKTAANKDIRRIYNIKARDVNKHMRIDRYSARRKSAILIASGPRIGLIYFGAKEKKITGKSKVKKNRKRVSRGKGVTVRVLKKSGRKQVLGKNKYGGFIAELNSGHRGIFMRTSADRLPIDELEGPGVAHMLNKSKAAFFTVVEQQSSIIFERELDFFVSKEVLRHV